MAYENEIFITELADSYSDEIFNETKEVYAKAKAFDEIKKSIIQIKCNYKGNEERINKFIARETEYIIYMEDE